MSHDINLLKQSPSVVPSCNGSSTGVLIHPPLNLGLSSPVVGIIIRLGMRELGYVRERLWELVFVVGRDSYGWGNLGLGRVRVYLWEYMSDVELMCVGAIVRERERERLNEIE